MFKIDRSENDRISINRGDSGQLNLHAASAFFAAGDKVKFKVTTSGNYTDVKLDKTFIVPAGASTTDFEIYLLPEDTRTICTQFASGSLTFWYEISVENAAGTHVSTVKGADENGNKEFVIYPEGAELA